MNKKNATLIIAVKLTSIEEQKKAVITFCDPQVTIIHCKPRNRFNVKGVVTTMTLDQMQQNNKIRHNLSRIATHMYLVHRHMSKAFPFKGNTNDTWLDESDDVQMKKQAMWHTERPPLKNVGRTANG